MTRILVIRHPEPERLKDFFEMMGLYFVEEKHGDGPLHYACLRGDNLVEIYPGNLSTTWMTEP